jgi:hypothetical protein
MWQKGQKDKREERINHTQSKTYLKRKDGRTSLHEHGDEHGQMAG